MGGGGRKHVTQAEAPEPWKGITQGKMVVMQTPGNGNCLFYALKLALNPTNQNMAKQVNKDKGTSLNPTDLRISIVEALMSKGISVEGQSQQDKETLLTTMWSTLFMPSSAP